MNSFYITLPSTASSSLYNNSQTHFRVQLPQQLELQGEWAVGLSEIHVPTAWDNIDDQTNSFNVHIFSEGKPENHVVAIPGFSFQGTGWDPFKALIKHIQHHIPANLKPHIVFHVGVSSDRIVVSIRADEGFEVELSEPLKGALGTTLDSNTYQSLFASTGHSKTYHSGKGLLMRITQAIPSSTDTRQLKIPNGLYVKTDHILNAMKEVMTDDVRDKINFKSHRDGTLSIICNEGVELEFPTSLGTLLGFSEEQRTLKGITKGKYTVDLKRGVYGMYVYSDIIEPHMVGDTFASLLRVIPVSVESKFEASYVKIYSNPDFYKVMQRSFDSIEIDIRSDFGERLKFRHGKTLVKLLFKKV